MSFPILFAFSCLPFFPIPYPFFPSIFSPSPFHIPPLAQLGGQKVPIILLHFVHENVTDGITKIWVLHRFYKISYWNRPIQTVLDELHVEGET